MKIKHLPEDERPMEKCLSAGAEFLSSSELIALLINSGTREKSAVALAEEVIAADRDGIAALSGISPQELMNIKGIGKAKAVRIVAAVELGKRIAKRPAKVSPVMRDEEDVIRFFMEDLRHEKREVFKEMLLDAKGAVISVETVSIGELTSTLVHPREVFSSAVKKSAAAVIFVHNHPSGDPSPSREDVLTTCRLMECGRILGIRVIDHFVIGDGKYASVNIEEKLKEEV